MGILFGGFGSTGNANPARILNFFAHLALSASKKSVTASALLFRRRGPCQKTAKTSDPCHSVTSLIIHTFTVVVHKWSIFGEKLGQ